MRYYKTKDDDDFVSVSTIDADGNGNSTKAEHDEIAEMYSNAPDGYGVIETANGFEYAARPIDPDPELDDSELLDILMGVTE